MIIWHKINNSSHLEALNELQPSFPLLPFIQGDPLTSPYSRTGCGYRIRSTSSWGAFTSGPGRNFNVSMATWSNQHPSWWFIPSLNQVQRDGRRLRVETRQVWHKNYGCYWLLVITDNYTLPLHHYPSTTRVSTICSQRIHTNNMCDWDSVILHLQAQTFAFTWTEVVPRCVRADWDPPTAPVCPASSCQLMVKAAPRPQMEQQVIYFKLSE